jgi:osmotically-inducible protein OsmY
MRIIVLTLVHALIFAVLCYFVATSQAVHIQATIYDDVRMHLARASYDLKAADISVSVDGRAVTLSANTASLAQLEPVMTAVQYVPGVLSVAIVPSYSN